MKVHELAAEGRAIAQRMRRAHGRDLRDQNAVEFLSERAGELDRLMDELVTSLDVRNAETRLGGARPNARAFGGVVEVDGKLITHETLFRRPVVTA